MKKNNKRRNVRDRPHKEEIFDKEAWKPITGIGKKVKASDIANIDQILDQGLSIREPEIIDLLMPGIASELLLVGQSKGKFGGGQRRVFKQTQKKTQEGNKPRFATFCVLGDNDGHIGLGYGKSKETVPAREKATRRAKLNVMKIKRGCGSWQCACKQPHSIPFAVEGKCGSCKITLIPAPRGTGLKIEKECGKVLKMAGIQDVVSKTQGQTKTKINLITACFSALQQLINTKVAPHHNELLGAEEGSTKQEESK